MSFRFLPIWFYPSVNNFHRSITRHRIHTPIAPRPTSQPGLGLIGAINGTPALDWLNIFELAIHVESSLIVRDWYIVPKLTIESNYTIHDFWLFGCSKNVPTNENLPSAPSSTLYLSWSVIPTSYSIIAWFSLLSDVSRFETILYEFSIIVWFQAALSKHNGLFARISGCLANQCTWQYVLAWSCRKNCVSILQWKRCTDIFFRETIRILQRRNSETTLWVSAIILP